MSLQDRMRARKDAANTRQKVKENLYKNERSYRADRLIEAWSKVPEVGAGLKSLPLVDARNVAINGVSNSIISNLDHLDFDFWGNSDSTAAVKKGVKALTFVATGDSLKIMQGAVQVGAGVKQSDGTWNLTIGGVQTKYNTGTMFLDFQSFGNWYSYLGIGNLSTEAEKAAARRQVVP